MPNLSHIYLFSLLIPLFSGCASVNYYQQAAEGQLSMMWNRVPVADVVADPQTPEALKQKLIRAWRARRFAAESLQLPVDGSFREFVDIGRSHVVYNLVATPEFSLQPKAWCYLVIGCQSYRGYFNLDDARNERERHEKQGFDTFIGGVTAYSTLGWFDDPLHTGFVRLSDERMVALIFHELAHQQLYIAGDTRFNESFATAVEIEGLQLWLEHTGQRDLFEQFRTRRVQREQTRQLIEQTARELEPIYARADTLDAPALRAQKEDRFMQLRQRYRQLSADWTQPGPLDQLLDHLNNAVLGLFQQYNSDVPAFRQLFKASGRDFETFYTAVEQLSEASPKQRRKQLDRLGEMFDEDL